jgi:hypothetical protein
VNDFNLMTVFRVCVHYSYVAFLLIPDCPGLSLIVPLLKLFRVTLLYAIETIE